MSVNNNNNIFSEDTQLEEESDSEGQEEQEEQEEQVNEENESDDNNEGVGPDEDLSEYIGALENKSPSHFQNFSNMINRKIIQPKGCLDLLNNSFFEISKDNPDCTKIVDDILSILNGTLGIAIINSSFATQELYAKVNYLEKELEKANEIFNKLSNNNKKSVDDDSTITALQKRHLKTVMKNTIETIKILPFFIEIVNRDGNEVPYERQLKEKTNQIKNVKVKSYINTIFNKSKIIINQEYQNIINSENQFINNNHNCNSLYEFMTRNCENEKEKELIKLNINNYQELIKIGSIHIYSVLLSIKNSDVVAKLSSFLSSDKKNTATYFENLSVSEKISDWSTWYQHDNLLKKFILKIMKITSEQYDSLTAAEKNGLKIFFKYHTDKPNAVKVKYSRRKLLPSTIIRSSNDDGENSAEENRPTKKSRSKHSQE